MITNEQQDRLKELLARFLEENSRINLSALRKEEQCWIGNVLDSLPFMDLVPSLALPDSGASVIDIGTGGGFPLLPLALLLPQHTFTGLDSVGKKIDAIHRIANGMGMQNVSFINQRIEECGRDPRHRELYDVVTARALAPLNVLIEYAAPLLKVGGHLIAWKSMQIEQELQESLLARAELSCHLETKHAYTLPADFGTRQLLVFKKTFKTDQKYPRETGMPKKKPIT